MEGRSSPYGAGAPRVARPLMTTRLFSSSVPICRSVFVGNTVLIFVSVYVRDQRGALVGILVLIRTRGSYDVYVLATITADCNTIQIQELTSLSSCSPGTIQA